MAENMPPNPPKVIIKILNAIRRGLARMGITKKWTKNELLELLARAKKSAETKNTQEQDTNSTRYALNENFNSVRPLHN